MGASNAWAEEVFGTTSDGYLGARSSSSITVYDGGTLHYQFSQVTAATANAQGFVLVAENRGGDKLIALRQDNWENVAWANTGCTNNYDWDNFLTIMNGASVDMTVTYNSGTFTMSATITGSDSNNYTYGYTKALTGSPNAIVVYLSEEASQITLTTSDYTNSNIVATLDHTASSSRNGSNSITTTIDQASEHYNNTKAAAWGGWAYAQFSFTIPEGHSVESASLMWSTNIGGSSTTNRDNTIYYANSGQSIDYANTTSTTNVNLTGSATSLTNVSLAGLTDHKDVVTDVTTAVRAISASQGYIIFEWTNNAAGADLYGKASSYAPILVIKTTTETFYEATFTESAGLTPTITIYTDDTRTETIENGALSANTTYYYTATLEGYTDHNGSFAVEASNPTINFTMTAKPRYTFTVNLVNSDGGATIETAYTDADSYDGKVHIVGFSKYLTDGSNRVTYAKDDDTYYIRYVSSTAEATQTVSYTAYNGIAYFIEGETLNTLKNNLVESGNLSGNRGGRGLNNSTTDVITIPVTGKYNMTYAACSNNVNASRTYSFYKNNAENVIETQSCNWSVNSAKNTGTKTVSNLALTTGDVIKFYGADTQLILDYVLLELESIDGTIASSGYSSLATAYGLDFSTAIGLTAAYVVTATTNDAVTLTSVDELPANSGVILKGTADAAYSIPVKADAAYDGTNLLSAAVSATPIEANTAYILQGGLFHLVTAASTVPAGKAYLLKSNVPSSARYLGFAFVDDEATGINSVSSYRQNGEFYNLQGQRVDAPKKGLYIVNGVKVIIK